MVVLKDLKPSYPMLTSGIKIVLKTLNTLFKLFPLDYVVSACFGPWTEIGTRRSTAANKTKQSRGGSRN